MSSNSPYLVVIRPFRREDQAASQDLIRQGTMDPINRFFLQALMRETFLQAVIMLAAMMFIIGGVRLHYTILSLPIVVVLTYVGIYIAHYYKAKYLHSDLANIQKTYMSSDKTCFFVAEAFYNKNDMGWKTGNNEKPAFVSEIEFEQIDKTGQISNDRELTRELVGTISVMRAKESAVIAWLRRTAVKKEWRAKGVGSALVNRVIKFCSQKGFIGIELVTTECHDSARKLYERKGFEVRAFYHKKFFKLSGMAIMMYAMHYKTRPFRESAIDL
jgi:GNAT superfamily N-acetyltransferase